MAPIVTSLATLINQFGFGAITAAPSGGGTGLTATGGVISDYTDGPAVYRAHVFTSTGTFTVSAPGIFGDTVEYLVVAGGGCGGATNGVASGAGSGGLRTNVPGVVNAASSPLTISTPFPVSTTGGNGTGGYTVTVGAGGAGGTPNSPSGAGSKGTSSYFGPPSTPNGITVTGGGQGRNNTSSPYAGYSGGSGSGGVGNVDSQPLAGSGNEGGNIDSKPEGNPGSSGGPSGNYGSGGGGGAGSSGGNYSPGSTGGAGAPGGAGVQVAIAGPASATTGVGALNPGPGQYQWFAGGGGGSGWGGGAGTGGVGGGGAAAPPSGGVAGNSGSPGTGGGGGGGSGSGHTSPPLNGGNGGSGIVVVRYQIASLTATAKATGGAISYAGGKTIHTFVSSGTFGNTSGSPLSAEYLIVAGGGGGGCANVNADGSGGG